MLTTCRTVTMQLHVYAKTANNVHYFDGPWTPSITARSILARTTISNASAEKHTYQYSTSHFYRIWISLQRTQTLSSRLRNLSFLTRGRISEFSFCWLGDHREKVDHRQSEYRISRSLFGRTNKEVKQTLKNNIGILRVVYDWCITI